LGDPRVPRRERRGQDDDDPTLLDLPKPRVGQVELPGDATEPLARVGTLIEARSPHPHRADATTSKSRTQDRCAGMSQISGGLRSPAQPSLDDSRRLPRSKDEKGSATRT